MRNTNDKIKLFVIVVLIFVSITSCATESKSEESSCDNWNNGYCSDCGSRLDYEKCGSMYHYRCPVCNKEYVFTQAQKYGGK